MDSQIKQLQEKYWRAETTPEEEQLLKKWMSESTQSSTEINYFKAVADQQKQMSDFPFQHPKKRIRGLWYTIAASLVIGLLVVGGLSQRQPAQSIYNLNDPQAALEVTRQALMMVSSGLNEGKTYTTQLNQINKPKNILSKNYTNQ